MRFKHTHTHRCWSQAEASHGFCSKRRRFAKAVQRSVESFVTQTHTHKHTVQQNGVNGVCRGALGMVWRVFVRNKYEQRLLAKTGHCVSCVCSNVCVCVCVCLQPLLCVYSQAQTTHSRMHEANTHAQDILRAQTISAHPRCCRAVTIRVETHALRRRALAFAIKCAFNDVRRIAALECDQASVSARAFAFAIVRHIIYIYIWKNRPLLSKQTNRGARP